MHGIPKVLRVKIFGFFVQVNNYRMHQKMQVITSLESDVKYLSFFDITDAWYEVGQDALALDEKPAKQQYAGDLETNERLVLESGAIVFTFETGSGNITMPLMLIETDIDLQVFDWSRHVINKYE